MFDWEIRTIKLQSLKVADAEPTKAITTGGSVEADDKIFTTENIEDYYDNNEEDD